VHARHHKQLVCGFTPIKRDQLSKGALLHVAMMLTAVTQLFKQANAVAPEMQSSYRHQEQAPGKDTKLQQQHQEQTGHSLRGGSSCHVLRENC